jgi:hypothetical protein
LSRILEDLDMLLTQTKLRAVQRYRNRGIAIALLLGLAVAIGCDITRFRTPGIVGLNDLVALKVDVASVATATTALDLHVMLRVPSGWTVQPAISSWSGTVNGIPASGTPTVSSSNPSSFCDFTSLVGAPPSGMKDVYFTESFTSFLDTDTGTLDARFAVAGPTGDFALVAATGYDEGGTSGSCIESVSGGVRVLTAVPIDQPWALVGLSLGLLAAALLATRNLAPHAFGWRPGRESNSRPAA